MGDSRNGSAIIWCVQCLQQLNIGTPNAIYWSYVSLRARALRLPVDTLEELALARMACLLRAFSIEDVDLLGKTWDALNHLDRQILVEHFLADGIEEMTFV